MSLSVESLPTESPTVISAEDLHRTLLKAHLIGNLARMKFIEALRIRDCGVAEDLVAALRSLGYSAKAARHRIDRATERVVSDAGEVTEEAILAEALRL